MGVFDGMFGRKPALEAVDPSSEAARRLDAVREQLADLAARANDRLEAVPGEHGVFVFVGKPPKAFGLVWYRDGEEYNFRKLVEEEGISRARVERLADALRTAYNQTASDLRYSYALGDRSVVVTPSAALEALIEEAVAATA